jgi:hypothetical protein
MREQENFIGWDFKGSNWDGAWETWDMPEEGGYPILCSTSQPLFNGSGTAEDPYLIGSADHLLMIPHDIGAHYRLTHDIDLQGQSFSQPIVPIFWGCIDGDRHIIANFTLTSEGDIGFFGILHADAAITGLTLRSVHMLPLRGGTVRLAGILAVRNGGTIAACSVIADTTIWGDSAEYIGGLVAVNEEGGEISRCSVSWAATGWLNRGGRASWGGITGHNIGSVVQCRASAFVGGQIDRCAALVGQNDGNIIDCYADGYNSVAGLVHSNFAKVMNSYAAVTVPSGWDKGGLVSKNMGGTITNSYFLTQADNGGPDNGLGIPLSDTQMKRQANFSGWDFDEIWTICEGEGYPRLRWEGAGCEP